MKCGNLDQDHAKTPYTGKDIRFTTKKGSIYAWLMTWPAEGQALIRSLATPVGRATGVALLGSKEKLDWKQTDAGLTVHLPAAQPCQFAYGLKIFGENLKAAPPKN